MSVNFCFCTYKGMHSLPTWGNVKLYFRMQQQILLHGSCLQQLNEASISLFSWLLKTVRGLLGIRPHWSIFIPLKCWLCYVCGFNFPTLWNRPCHINLCVLITQNNALYTPSQYSRATLLNMSSVPWPWLAHGWKLLPNHLLCESRRVCPSESMLHVS